MNNLKKNLLDEKVVVVPTATLPGLSVLYNSNKARQELSRIKNRPLDRNFIILARDKGQVKDLFKLRFKLEEKLMDSFWPGALTLVLDTDDGSTIAVRVDGNPLTRELVDAVGQPIISTSINESGSSSLVDTKLIEQFSIDNNVYFETKEYKESKNNESSTLVRVESEEKITLLREGLLWAKIQENFPFTS